MFKVLIVFVSALAFGVGMSLYADGDITDGCLLEDGLWGSEDATKYYLCLPGTNQSLELSCPSNTLFVRNETASGCVPIEFMNPNCVNNVEVGPCEGENLRQPQPHSEPTKFYLCTSEGAEPIPLSCAEGTAFVKQNGYLGCFQWSQWRALRDCPE